MSTGVQLGSLPDGRATDTTWMRQFETVEGVLAYTDDAGTLAYSLETAVRALTLTGFSLDAGGGSSWHVRIGAGVGVTRKVALPGLAATGIYVGINDGRALALPIVLQPRVLPPVAFALDGADASQNGTLASARPTLSWTPGSGTPPTGYLVMVMPLVASGTQTTLGSGVRLVTRATTLRLPTGLLLPGEFYVFRLTAALSPGNDVAVEPFNYLYAEDLAFADTLSGAWQTPQ